MADDKKNEPISKSSREVDDEWDSDAADKDEPRSQQDSLYEDEDWEDADDEGDEEREDESDEDEDEDDDDDDEDDEEPVDEDDDDDDDDDDDEEPVDEDDETEDWLPDWAPWAVLASLILLGLAGGFGLLTPGGGDARPTAAGTPTPSPATEPETANPMPAPAVPSPAQPQEAIGASHLLVSYKGALRANPQITRSQTEAKQRAEEALKKAKAAGADFAKIVAEYSDEPGAGARGGKLGKFTRDRMVKPFSDAAFQLKVDEVSEVVETRFGYHVIKRTE